MNHKQLDYQGRELTDADGQANRSRAMRPVGKIVACVIGCVLVVVVIGVVVYQVRIKQAYPDRTTELRCVDSVTGKPLQADADVVGDGGLDDDQNKTWSIGPDENGRLLCSRNVWVEVEITTANYRPEKLRLDEKTPTILFVKLHAIGK